MVPPIALLGNEMKSGNIFQSFQFDLFIVWFCIFTNRGTPREQFKNKRDNGFPPPDSSVHT
jgi:hypothetical protein